MPTSKSGSA